MTIDDTCIVLVVYYLLFDLDSLYSQIRYTTSHHTVRPAQETTHL